VDPEESLRPPDFEIDESEWKGMTEDFSFGAS